MSESSLSIELLLSLDMQLQNLMPEQTLWSSQGNMNDDTVHNDDDIQVDVDGSQKVQSSINVNFASSIPKARGRNSGNTKTNLLLSPPMWMKSQILTSNSMKLLLQKTSKLSVDPMMKHT